MFLSIPATIALILASEEIISALFGYGSFSEESVINSSKALFYFGLGLPAFSLIKVFSSFFFANQDTKTPFYVSLVSVFLNIVVSISYFEEFGFIIIPISTTISSWFNSILLFILLKNKNLFKFNEIFIVRFIKIVVASIAMGIFFNFLIFLFSSNLIYEYSFKSIYLILCVFLSLVFYLLVAFFINAIKYEDIKLRY